MFLRRFLRYIPTLLCMAAIFWFSAQPGDEVARAADPLFDMYPTIGQSPPIPWLKVGHIIGYSGLGAALMYGLGARSRWAGLTALGVTLLYAISDEIHQTFTPGRHAGLNDVVIDLAAAGLVILGIWAWGRRLRGRG